jgi:hypothetical protein
MRKDIAAALILLSFTFLGCEPKMIRTETQMHQLFTNDFRGFPVPSNNEMKKGISKTFPYTTYEEVWNSTVIVLMQECLIPYSSKEFGNIIGLTRPPMAIHIEYTNDKKVIVYIYWMSDLYEGIDERKELLVKFSELTNKGNDFFDKLSTQLYSSKKWKYLNYNPIVPN